MQEIVNENINDLEFLKGILNIEIITLNEKIKKNMYYLKVQEYISIIKKEEQLINNKIYYGSLKNKLDDYKTYLIETYKEVKEYAESQTTLIEYQKKKKQLEKYIIKEGIIYNKENINKKIYSKEFCYSIYLDYCQKEEIRPSTNINKINLYLKQAMKKLISTKNYTDDEIIEDIFGYKIYQNPANYTIEYLKEPTDNIIPYYIEQKELTNREQLAFYGKIIKEKQKIKIERRDKND